MAGMQTDFDPAWEAIFQRIPRGASVDFHYPATRFFGPDWWDDDELEPDWIVKPPKPVNDLLAPTGSFAEFEERIAHLSKP
jgi:hypothetical protein